MIEDEKKEQLTKRNSTFGAPIPIDSLQGMVARYPL
jgi:hypothetical protein